MKGDGSAWASELRQLIRYMGLTLCIYYGDVWMRVAVDTLELGAMSNDCMHAGERYYEYVSIHVDNLIVDICIEEQVMQDISKTYQLNKYFKNGSYSTSSIYLVSHSRSHKEPYNSADSLCCTIFSYHHVKNIVANAHKKLT